MTKNSSDLGWFCQDELWDLSLTWYTEQPDFTKCFHATVLVYVPCGCLWLFLPVWLILRDSSPLGVGHSSSKWASVTKLRLLVAAILLTVNLAQLGLKLKGYFTPESLPSSQVLAPAVLSMTYALYVSVVVWLKTAGVQRSNGYLFLFWSLLTLASMLTMTSVARFPDTRPSADNVLLVMYFCLNSVMFLLEFSPNPDVQYVNIDSKTF